MCGGVVGTFDDFFDDDGSKDIGYRNIYLLSPKTTRTEKFLLALAVGIPRIRPSWVYKCIEMVTITTFRSS